MLPTGINSGVSSIVSVAKPIRPDFVAFDSTWRNPFELDANGANQSLQNNFQERLKRLPNEDAAGESTLVDSASGEKTSVLSIPMSS
jgi:hypothetical protein